MVGYHITVTKQHTVEICVSEESLAHIRNSMTVVQTLTHLLVVLQVHSLHQELLLISTGVLVIWLVVMLTRHSRAAVEVDMVLVLALLVGEGEGGGGKGAGAGCGGGVKKKVGNAQPGTASRCGPMKLTPPSLAATL